MSTAGVAHDEELGRGVFSSGNAKRAKRNRVPYHVFLVKLGCADISVDRLTMASEDDAETVAEATADARGATFYGWAVVTADKARESGRRVVSAPVPGNSRHANIVLPQVAADDREEQKRHAQELADASTWRAANDRRRAR